MSVWAYALLSVVIVSVTSLVGVFIIIFKEERFKKISLFIVSFAVGALLGDAFIHILPESFGRSPSDLTVSILIILGTLVFFVLEKFIRWRHCHISNQADHYHPVVAMNMVGDGVHNFIDGLLIGASYLISVPIGIATSVAIFFHEIPQEFGDFSVLVHGGVSAKRALIFNFFLSLAGVLGVVISLLIGSRVKDFAFWLLPITAGGFLYIAGSDLIPELHHDIKFKNSFIQLISICFGVLTMIWLRIFFQS